MKMNTKIIEVRIKDSKLCCYTKMIIQSCVLKNNPRVAVWIFLLEKVDEFDFFFLSTSWWVWLFIYFFWVLWLGLVCFKFKKKKDLVSCLSALTPPATWLVDQKWTASKSQNREAIYYLVLNGQSNVKCQRYSTRHVSLSNFAEFTR